MEYKDLKIGDEIFLYDSYARNDDGAIVRCVVETYYPTDFDIRNGHVEGVRIVPLDSDTNYPFTIRPKDDLEGYLFASREEVQHFLDECFSEWVAKTTAMDAQELARFLLGKWSNEYTTDREYEVMKAKIEKEFNVML